jgi:hypothetical protein
MEPGARPSRRLTAAELRALGVGADLVRAPGFGAASAERTGSETTGGGDGLDAFDTLAAPRALAAGEEVPIDYEGGGGGAPDCNLDLLHHFGFTLRAPRRDCVRFSLGVSDALASVGDKRALLTTLRIAPDEVNFVVRRGAALPWTVMALVRILSLTPAELAGADAGCVAAAVRARVEARAEARVDALDAAEPTNLFRFETVHDVLSLANEARALRMLQDVCDKMLEQLGSDAAADERLLAAADAAADAADDAARAPLSERVGGAESVDLRRVRHALVVRLGEKRVLAELRAAAAAHWGALLRRGMPDAEPGALARCARDGG